MHKLVENFWAHIIVILVTVGVPALGKMYVDLKHTEVIKFSELKHRELISEIKLLRKDLHYAMEMRGLPIPKSLGEK